VDSFVYVSLGLIALGALFLLRTIAFLRGAVAAEGTDRRHHALVRAARPDPQPDRRVRAARRQQFTEDGSSSCAGVEVGETVRVKFDPERPERARIDKPFRLWGVPVFFFMMGALFLLASLA
jgi:hypothetical protein